MAHLKAVIFDMDGVLFLSVGVHEQAYKETFATIGIHDFDYAELAGMRTDAAIKKLFTKIGRPISEEEVEKLRQDKTERARLALDRYGQIVPESIPLINYLRQNYRLALASSASPHNIELFLNRCGYQDAFEFCLNGTVVNEAKPSPEIYLLSLQKLGLEPLECLVVEDATNGVQAAVAAGIPVVAVLGTEKPEKLREAGAGYVVEDLQELLFLIKEQDEILFATKS